MAHWHLKEGRAGGGGLEWASIDHLPRGPVIISWTVLTLQAVWDSRLQFEMLTVSPGTREVMESATCLIFEVRVYIVWASRVTSMWNTRL